MRSSSAAVVFGIQARGTLELDVVTAASDAAPEGSELASIDAAKEIHPPVMTSSDARFIVQALDGARFWMPQA